MSASDSQLIVFTDFDGTISKRDVGNRLFHHFSDGKSEEIVALWKKNEIDSKKCLIGEASTMRPVTEKELFEYIDSFEIDETFEQFTEFLKSKQIPLYILSDGLDLYIKRILSRNGFSELTIFANQAKLVDGRFEFEFPFFEHSCGSCANCKGYHIRRLRRPDTKTIYIGDGKSDLCAVPEADIIFAKDYLADYCKNQKIEYLPFDNFSAITELLKSRFV